MIANKHVTKIIAVVVAIAVILCLSAMAFSDKIAGYLGGAGVSQEYESKLFDTSDIVSMDIKMDTDEWQEMLDDATSEVYHQCDVVINGTTFYSVGIRPKGNTSLSSIASDPDNNRYSFKLEFDHYVEGQTCWGLDKLVLNNNFSDATNMKEAVIYDMYQYLGVDASLYNYAKISVNGSYWGVYLALEAVEDSFMLRNYGVESGELYKPDSMEMGGGQGNGGGKPAAMPDKSNLPQDFDRNSLPENANMGTPPEGFSPDNAPGGVNGSAKDALGGGNVSAENAPSDGNVSTENTSDSVFGGFGGKGGAISGSNGANLNYTDDELDSYSTIWDGSVTDSSDTDHSSVVTALKNISQGTELETYLDVDNVLKYMAVHSFAVNDDSLSGSMAHNYYLYENDGQLNILPWDYNLSFGGMGGNGGSSAADGVINDPIDTPFSGTNFFDSLLENEEYLERYHQYYNQLVEEYVFGDGFDQTYNRIRSQIDELVETDPNAMYSYDEYEAAAAMLYNTVMLRAESVRGQLNGTIPSTADAQQANPEALIDASEIDIKAMGTFSGGGGDFGGRNSAADENADTSGSDGASIGRAPSDVGGNISDLKAPSDGSADTETLKNAVWFAGCFILLLLALLCVKHYRRKPSKK